MYIAAGGPGLMQSGLPKLVRQCFGPALPWFGIGWRMSWFGRRGKSVGPVEVGLVGLFR